MGYASFMQKSVAEQHKGRTAALRVLIAAHIRLRNPERKENKQNAPFLRAIKQSVVKSARQCSAVKEQGVQEAKRLQREREDGLENGEENRACLPQGANSQK